MIFLIWGLVLLAAIVLYFRQVYSHYARKGVKAPGVLWFFGNMGGVVFRREHFVDNLDKVYRAYPEERFVGRFEFMKPVMLVKDLELIKKVTIKDFEHFLDHASFTSENDPMFTRNLFSLKGQEWKDMRSTLSPAFTSSKMKLMTPFIVDAGEQMVQSVRKSIRDSGVEYQDIDVKDLTTRFANDVIATCAFGLKVDSHTERDNEFYSRGLDASTFKFRQLMLFFLFGSFPKLAEIITVPLFSERVQNFFRSLVLDTMQEREKRSILRPDMIHLLMEAKKGKLSHDEKTQDTDAGFATVEESSVGKKSINRVWSDDDLIAQAVLFFIAGFETASSGMTFLMYELAVNPDVQDKLAKEIREADSKNGGKFDYTAIQELQYLDMVISELLRLWPPGIALDRLCNKDYNLGKPNEKATEDYILRKGEVLRIPVWSIHRDATYFPKPLKFDPERFSDENKHNIRPFTYMPFGLGPRNCIGSRFALSELKVMVYKMILNMEVSPAPSTRIPAQLETESFNLRMQGGSTLRIRERVWNK